MTNILILPTLYLDDVWPAIAKGMKISIIEGRCNFTLMDMHDAIASGQMTLFLVYEKGRPYENEHIFGFSVCHKQHDPLGGVLDVALGYSDPRCAIANTGVDYFSELYQYMERYATVLGCHAIQVSSPRKGYMRRIKGMDFQPWTTTYRKTLNSELTGG